jgi:RimJ/RimL family protein N-acetyltransferase
MLNEDQHGVYALRDSVAIGHAWAKISRTSKCRVNGYLDIRLNEAAIHYCFVAENERGNNIYPAMLIALCDNLRSREGVARILIDAERDNIASIRGIQKAGFMLLGTAVYVQVMGRLIFKCYKGSK